MSNRTAVSPSQTARSKAREADVRLALLLIYITLAWMTIEGAASLLLGWASNSLLLEAFGIDSVIELCQRGVSSSGGSGSALHGCFVRSELRRWSALSARWVGYSPYALVVYMLVRLGLWLCGASRWRITDTGKAHGLGILIASSRRSGCRFSLPTKLKVVCAAVISRRHGAAPTRSNRLRAATCRCVADGPGLAATRLFGSVVPGG